MYRLEDSEFQIKAFRVLDLRLTSRASKAVRSGLKVEGSRGHAVATGCVVSRGLSYS